MVDTVENAIYRMGLDGSQYAQQANVVTAANQKIISSATQLNAAEERVQQVTLQTADSFSRLEARYDPLIRAEQRRAAAIAQTNRFLEEGIVDQQRHAAQIARVNTFYDTMIGRLRTQVGVANVAGGAFRSYGRQIQQAGFQVGDFAVQLASGQNAIVALTQQGSQLLQVFGGPWGAVIGAAASIVGALAVGLFRAGEAADKAKEAADNYKDAIELSNQVLLTSQQLQEVRNQQLLEEARAKNNLTLETQKATLAELEFEAARGLRVSIGRGGSIVNPDLAERGITTPEQLRAELAKARQAVIDTVQRISDLYNPTKLFPEDPKKERGKSDAERLAEERARLAEAFERDLLSLQDRLDPIAGAERALTKEQDLLSMAFERGRISAEEYARSLDLLDKQYRDKLDPTTASLEKLNQAQDEQLRQLKAESLAAGMTAEARAIYLARIEAENRLLRENIPLSDQRAQAYIAEAEAIARIKAQGNVAQETGQTLQEVSGSIADGFGEAARQIATGTANLQTLGSIGEQVLNRLIELFIQMSIVNPLQAELAGFFGPSPAPTLGSIGRGGGGVATQPAPGGGFFADLFSGLFGFAHGGEFDVSGNGGTDSQLVAFRATPGERVTVQPQGVSNDNRRTSNITQNFYFPPSPNGFGYSEQQMRQRSIERAFTQGRNV